MEIYIRLVWESFGFAWRALRANLLRTILSLLGVTVGIFAIIAVLTVVNSLEKSIRSSYMKSFSIMQKRRKMQSS